MALTAEDYVREWVRKGRPARFQAWEQPYQSAGLIEQARIKGYLWIGSSVSCPITLTPEGEALVSQNTPSTC